MNTPSKKRKTRIRRPPRPCRTLGVDFTDLGRNVDSLDCPGLYAGRSRAEEQDLCAIFDLQPHVLMRLAARHGGDALNEVEDR